MYGDMAALAVIEVNATEFNGKVIPIRIIDIDTVWPVTGGAQIKLKAGGAPLLVNQTAEEVHDLWKAEWTAWLAAFPA